MPEYIQTEFAGLVEISEYYNYCPECGWNAKIHLRAVEQGTRWLCYSCASSGIFYTPEILEKLQGSPWLAIAPANCEHRDPDDISVTPLNLD